MIINKDYCYKIGLKSRERGRWRWPEHYPRKIEDAERAVLEPAASIDCKNMNIQVSIPPDTYTAKAFAGCRGLDINGIL